MLAWQVACLFHGVNIWPCIWLPVVGPINSCQSYKQQFFFTYGVILFFTIKLYINYRNIFVIFQALNSSHVQSYVRSPSQVLDQLQKYLGNFPPEPLKTFHKNFPLKMNGEICALRMLYVQNLSICHHNSFLCPTIRLLQSIQGQTYQWVFHIDK